MDRDSKTFKEGKRRLKEMLGRAKAEARKQHSDLGMQPSSVLGQSVMNHIKEKNFEALVVYEDGPGKWYGDLVLRGLPPGVPSVLGTATSTPRASQKEALNDCYMILVGILRAIHERDTVARDKPLEDIRIFDLHGFEFKIPGKVVDELAAVTLATGMAESYDGEAALDFVRRKVEEICQGRELSEEVLDGAPHEKMAGLMAAMSIALVNGEFRYPRPETSMPHEAGERRKPSGAH